ncbi:uncharacterized protein [Haliotis asinina]|uniref:uncharacterized protein n=1 Tax=Haliotis asinina TaxID=109174 RepID=UPI0035318E4D
MDPKEGTSKDSSEEEKMLAVRKQRKILRGKMTRTMNRLSDYIELKVQNPKWFERELETLQVDFSNICIVHGELYEYVEEHEHPKLDEWESELISAMHETEDKVEHYLELQKGHTHEDAGGNIHSKDGQFKDQKSAAAVDTSQNLDDSIESSEENHGPTNMEDNHSVPARVSGPSNLMLGSTPTSADQTVFDKWIADLVEFEETKFPNIPDTMSISEALYKLQAAKDIPTITLKKFDGNPLEYVDFVERFRIHIHEKAHLTDDVRMAQLLMHLHGDASRAVSPLGSSGIMYATALKLLKDQFGHPSLIARSFINKLVNGSKIVPNNRNSLKDLSLDLIASIATLKRLNYFADVNSNDILRKIIARLPSHLIDKWKVVAADLREKGEVPSVIHISDFVRKRVKAEFDPDFGDIDKSRVVRALFRAPNGRICQGNVLIDGGAGTTIIRKGFSIALGLQGKVECLDISVVGGRTVKQSNSRRVHCKLSSLEGGEEFDIEAFELDNTVEDVPNLDKAWLKSFSYLRDIEFSCKGGPIDLILGVQYSHIHADEEIRQGLPFEPVAKRSKLGCENKNSHPDGAVILERDRYMDDLIHSCPSDDIAVERVRQVDDILMQVSERMVQWHTKDGKPQEGMRLAKSLVSNFKEQPRDVILWTDSKIVYYWVQAESVNFKQFVGVRIAEIQSVWKPEQWRFVPSDQNPADDLSRGISVEEINGRWMHGPDFLKLDSEQWPKDSDKTKLEESALEKRNSKVVTFCDTSSPVIDPERFSNWSRLVRVTGYCLRFIDKLHAKVRGQAYKHPGPCLQPEEINGAETYWVKFAQQSLGNWKTTLTDLAPFEKDGVIRAGGRLRQTSLQYDQVHPIILPAKHQIAKLIMRDVHEKLCHVGPERTLSESRRKYWIIRGRSMAKGIVRNCVTCRKLRQPVHQTLMSDLPAERLYPFSPPFTVTGVDLFGPFKLKYGRNKSIKAWGAIFSCASVRAIHLEIVADLSTQAFLQALRRFAAHHGWPQTIISDNGTSFVGAKRELKVLLQEGRKQIEEFAVLHKLKWKFITPLSPHQGGLYESLIKQVKCALQVVVGQQLLSWDEMSTVFAEVECLVNSRPLTRMSSDPNDLQPITPNNFVLGRASTEIPQGPFQEMTNLQKRFKFVQCLVQQVWKRFLREYVPTLMKRVKWQTKGRQLQVGDMVLLVDVNSPRGKWDLARILEVFPGKDGIVRNVKVKTSSGVYQRSVQKCCLILEENSSSQ